MRVALIAAGLLLIGGQALAQQPARVDAPASAEAEQGFNPADSRACLNGDVAECPLSTPEERAAAAEVAQDRSGGPNPLMLWISLLAVAYFIPSGVAVMRGKRNAMAIVVLNLLLGWTFLGWVLALVWSVLSDPPQIPVQTS